VQSSSQIVTTKKLTPSVMKPMQMRLQEAVDAEKVKLGVFGTMKGIWSIIVCNKTPCYENRGQPANLGLGGKWP